MNAADIRTLLGDQAKNLLDFNAPKISRERLHLPGPDFVDRTFAPSNRNNRVLVNLQRMYGGGPRVPRLDPNAAFAA